MIIDDINTTLLPLGIFLQEDDRHIGNIKIGPVVTRHARAELGLAKIAAGIYETNIGSAKALLKAGFKLEATISSRVIFDRR